MKRLDEMTKEELVAITVEQIETIITLETAERGIEYAADPGPFDDGPSPEKTVNLFTVSVPGANLHFKDQETAFDFARTFGSKVVGLDYDWQIGSDYRWMKPPREEESDITVGTLSVYDEATVKAYATKIKGRRERHAAHKKRQDAYRAYQNDVDAIRDEVYDTIRGARLKIAEVEEARRKFEEFFRLADGNRSVAARFFLNAYKARPDLAEILDIQAETNEEAREAP